MPATSRRPPPGGATRPPLLAVEFEDAARQGRVSRLLNVTVATLPPTPLAARRILLEGASLRLLHLAMPRSPLLHLPPVAATQPPSPTSLRVSLTAAALLPTTAAISTLRAKGARRLRLPTPPPVPPGILVAMLSPPLALNAGR